MGRFPEVVVGSSVAAASSLSACQPSTAENAAFAVAFAPGCLFFLFMSFDFLFEIGNLLLQNSHHRLDFG